MTHRQWLSSFHSFNLSYMHIAPIVNLLERDGIWLKHQQLQSSVWPNPKSKFVQIPNLNPNLLKFQIKERFCCLCKLLTAHLRLVSPFLQKDFSAPKHCWIGNWWGCDATVLGQKRRLVGLSQWPCQPNPTSLTTKHELQNHLERSYIWYVFYWYLLTFIDIYWYLFEEKKQGILWVAPACHRFDIYFPSWSVFLQSSPANFWLLSANFYINFFSFFLFLLFSHLLVFFCSPVLLITLRQLLHQFLFIFLCLILTYLPLSSVFSAVQSG